MPEMGSHHQDFESSHPPPLFPSVCGGNRANPSLLCGWVWVCLFSRYPPPLVALTGNHMCLFFLCVCFLGGPPKELLIAPRDGHFFPCFSCVAKQDSGLLEET